MDCSHPFPNSYWRNPRKGFLMPWTSWSEMQLQNASRALCRWCLLVASWRFSLFWLVLGLVGRELNSLIEDGGELCFGFMMKTVLITLGCFGYCWVIKQGQDIFCFWLPHQWVGWVCARSWEGTQPGQPTPTDQRDIRDHVVSPPAIKAEGWKFHGGFHC